MTPRDDAGHHHITYLTSSKPPYVQWPYLRPPCELPSSSENFPARLPTLATWQRTDQSSSQQCKESRLEDRSILSTLSSLISCQQHYRGKEWSSRIDGSSFSSYKKALAGMRESGTISIECRDMPSQPWLPCVSSAYCPGS